MGIVRDRQVPCTCETYNGHIGPSSGYSKESSENEFKSTSQNPQHEAGLSYSQSNEQSESTRNPYSQGEKQSHQFEVKASYVHNNDSEGSQPTDASSRPWDDGRLVYSQQGGQLSGASAKPPESLSSEYHLSGTDSPNGQQSQNNDASAEEGPLDTQRQQSRISEERNEAVQSDKSREDEENSIGTDYYPTNSEDNRKYDYSGHDERLKNDSHGSTQEHIQGSEIHRFAAGSPERYLPHVKIYAGDTSGKKPLTQDNYRAHTYQQSAEGEDTSQETHGPQGDSFHSTTYSHERVQGSGSQEQPSFLPSPSENNYGRPRKQSQYSESYSKGQGEWVSDYKAPSKVIAVGNAAEKYNTGAQEQNSQG